MNTLETKTVVITKVGPATERNNNNEDNNAVLQIRRVKRDNLGIIFHITPSNICCDPLLEPSRQDGSNEGSQHMFSLRNMKNIFELPSKPPLIWSCNNDSNDNQKILVIAMSGVNLTWEYTY